MGDLNIIIYPGPIPEKVQELPLAVGGTGGLEKRCPHYQVAIPGQGMGGGFPPMSLMRKKQWRNTKYVSVAKPRRAQYQAAFLLFK